MNSVNWTDEVCLNHTDSILSEILNTEWLDQWHESELAEAGPSILHYNMNYHHAAFERAEYFLKNAARKFTNTIKLKK